MIAKDKQKTTQRVIMDHEEPCKKCKELIPVGVAAVVKYGVLNKEYTCMTCWWK